MKTGFGTAGIVVRQRHIEKKKVLFAQNLNTNLHMHKDYICRSTTMFYSSKQIWRINYQNDNNKQATVENPNHLPPMCVCVHVY